MLQSQLSEVLGSLPERSAIVVRMRFGLDDGRPRTLDEVGRHLGLTRERIRQIERDTLAELRAGGRADGLREYVACPPNRGARPRRWQWRSGFGMGGATAVMAAAEPGLDLLAVEVHPAGIAALLRRLERAALTNVRVIDGDAVPVLEALPEACLTAGASVLPRSVAEGATRQAAVAARVVRRPGRVASGARGLPACRDRLAGLCRARAGGADGLGRRAPRPAFMAADDGLRTAPSPRGDRALDLIARPRR